ncbi:hypothetical protein Tco_0721892 [Tanacetum coccineum]
MAGDMVAGGVDQRTSKWRLDRRLWSQQCKMKFTNFDRLEVWEYSYSPSIYGYRSQVDLQSEALMNMVMDVLKNKSSDSGQKDYRSGGSQLKDLKTSNHTLRLSSEEWLCMAKAGRLQGRRRPDLVFAVCMCARYQAKPTKKHLEAIKHDRTHVGCQDLRRVRGNVLKFLGDNADVPSSVTETTDTTSTLQPPRPPLQTYSSSRYLNIRVKRWFFTVKMEIPARSPTSKQALGRGTCAISIRIDLVTTGKKDGTIRCESLSVLDILKMRWRWKFPVPEMSSVKASANSDVVYSFTSAQDGDPLQDDVRLCLGDDLKKAQDHNQRQV